MHREIKEYSLADLQDNPVVGLAMKREGIEPRSLELMIEDVRRDRQPPEPFGRPFCSSRLPVPWQFWGKVALPG
jgi:hypothetical protein